MKKLAIVSSYNESCGNASYTHVLKTAFSEHVVCDVLALDSFVLKPRSGPLAELGNRHIVEIAERLKEYDYVNIQFEAGLYGNTPALALRRLKTLISACRSVTVTMHRIDAPTRSAGGIIRRYAWDISMGRIGSGFRSMINSFERKQYEDLYRDIVEFCRERSATRPVWIAVHTKRERRIVQEMFGFKNVFDFPITFLLEEQRRALIDSQEWETFRRRHSIPAGVKVIGAFGFVSSYKGYETLVQALTLLPEDYHLYIFGGQHPQSVARNVALDPYLQKLIDLITTEDKKKRDLAKERPAAASSLDSSGVQPDAVESGARTHAPDLMSRVRFAGSLPDPDFIEALRFSDAVVLPYLEVGQSMSGVIALAVECNANLFCANNASFAEVRRYYGDVFVGFDIGNYVELAQKIATPSPDFGQAREAAFDRYNLRRNAALHLEKLGHPVPVSSLSSAA